MTEVTRGWKIGVRPEGRNPGRELKGRSKRQGKNEGGMVIQLVHAGTGGREEVARVAFERKHSINPDASYQDQFDEEMAKAKHALGVLNDLLDDSGTLR